MLAAKGKLEKTPIKFSAVEGVDFGGVLFLIPALLASGLLSYKSHYEDIGGYYDLDTIILSMAFLYLCRIKNPEQTKHISPGEFGRLLGLDRIPEAKSLRAKLSQIAQQNKARSWNTELAQKWVETEENTFYYIDGHVQVYSGNKANLGKKHISRLKLCLPGMTEFWVNNAEGLPFLVVTGEVNEKLQEIILDKIVPELLGNVALKISDAQLESDPDLPRFTLVFDREAYSPKFFEQLWQKYRIAVITYRKNVKDKWDDTDFVERELEMEGNKIKMQICEKQIELDKVKLREVRKKNNDFHQTSIITTNKKLSTIFIAIKMFARWTQENFFKYLRNDYALDHIVQYLINEVNPDFKVVNPLHRKLTNKLKKIREKTARREARLYNLINENVEENKDKIDNNFSIQAKIQEELQELKNQEVTCIKERKKQAYKIPVKEMEEKMKYNKLDIESKLLQNIIKMICYRAETNFAILLAADYKKKVNEMRALTKSLVKTKVNIIPDYINETLTVELFSLSNPRDNKAATQICQILNDTQTQFPGTSLTIIYKFAT